VVREYLILPDLPAQIMNRTLSAAQEGRGASTVVATVLLVGLVIAGSTVLVATSADRTAEQVSDLGGETVETNLQRLSRHV